MNEALNQKISQFIDDELDHDEALNLLQKIQADAELRATLSRYQAVSHAIKAETFVTVEAGFSEQLAQRIAEEPTYLLPRRQPTKLPYKRLAIAASVAALSVLVVRGAYHPFEQNVPGTNIQVARQEAPRAHAKAVPNPESYPLNARINDYLQAHNNTIYANNEADFRPLAKVTAYSRK